MDFSVISDFIIKNWVLFAGILAILSPNILNALKTLKNKINFDFDFLKNKNQVFGSEDIITKDREALMWLTNRAIDLNCDELVQELANVNQKLFNAHCDMLRATIKPNNG